MGHFQKSFGFISLIHLLNRTCLKREALGGGTVRQLCLSGPIRFVAAILEFLLVGGPTFSSHLHLMFLTELLPKPESSENMSLKEKAFSAVFCPCFNLQIMSSFAKTAYIIIHAHIFSCSSCCCYSVQELLLPDLLPFLRAPWSSCISLDHLPALYP